MGFLKPVKGNIKFNNKELNEKNVSIFQSNVILSPQFPYLFNETIEKNITLEFNDKKNINFKKLDIICNQLNIKKELKQFFGNPNKKIGPKSNNLSGGQIQRISLARALYNERELMIFDEPTNNLDNTNKKNVLNMIKSIKKNKIIIILSHDLDLDKYNFNNVVF